MIGSDEMSSTSMDISETFRPEDLSKTDFFDFVTAPDMGIGIGVGERPPGSNEPNGGGSSEQPLQGYDQFWGSDKDPSRIESAIFEDLDRYCWQHQQPPHPHSDQQSHAQPQTSADPSNENSSINQHSSIVSGIGNTDGQIYTLTVLNGTESWLKRDPDAPIAPTLDLDSLLGSFPSYVKSEFVYEDSGFSTDNTKDDLNQQSTGSLVPVTTVVTTNSTNLAQFQNNNNDWHMTNHNVPEQSSAESLLRSALQGKGYSKGLHIQNGIAIIPSANSIKDDELRRALFSPDQDPLPFADSTLSTPMFDDTHGILSSPTAQQQPPQTSQTSTNSTSSNNCSSNNSTNQSTTTAGIIVDDMFLSLETAFSDDFEKIKRIASEVQQFCSGNDYPEVIMEVTMPHQAQTLQVQAPPQPQPPPPQPLQPEVSTSNQTPTSTVTKTPAKKYKRASINSNNNNSSNNSNSSNNNNTSSNNNSSNSNSPSQCNGQRKERSLHYCSICSKGFKDKYSVNVHIRTHTGEKPFACSLCGKSFRQKAHLAKHYQTHLAQKNNGNVVKSGKHSQQALQTTNTGRQHNLPAGGQRQISSNTSSGPTLPPANGLLSNR